MVEKVLTKLGAVVQAHTMMYKAVVQEVLLYWSEIWVVTGAMLMVIEGFHHQMAMQIARKIAWCAGDGRWEWIPM